MLINPPPYQNPVVDQKTLKPTQFWQRWFVSIGTVIGIDGTYRPPTFSDADAPVNAFYYSSTTSKASYKDPAGVSHVLY